MKHEYGTKGHTVRQAEGEVVAGSRYVAACRVSSEAQRTHLEDQAGVVVRAIRRHGGVVAYTLKVVAHGTDPNWFLPAVEKAKELGAVAVVFESVDRIVRHPAFHPKERFDLMASDGQIVRACEMAEPVRLLTVYHPDTPLAEVKGAQTARGIKPTRARGRKKKADAHGAEWHERARELFQEGLSCRQIAKTVSEESGNPIAPASAWRWVKALESSRKLSKALKGPKGPKWPR